MEKNSKILDNALNDLFNNTAGGIVGSTLGILLISRNEKKCGHWKAADELKGLKNQRN